MSSGALKRKRARRRCGSARATSPARGRWRRPCSTRLRRRRSARGPSGSGRRPSTRSRAPLAAEARWRAGWVRYLAGDFVGAASWFERLAARSARGPRVAAEYWHARTLERLGREAEARARLVHVADRHPTSYYAAVAEARLGRPASAPAVPPAGQAPFPAHVGGAHGERARLLFGLALA